MMIKKVAGILLSALMLTACGGGSNDTEITTDVMNEQSTIALTAEDIITRSQINQTKTISLADRVHLSSGSNFDVVGIPTLLSIDDQCQLSMDGKKISVTSDQPADCLYQYKVATTDKKVSETAYLRVGFSSNYEENTLPIITKSLRTVAEEVINLRTELTSKGVDLTGYEVYPNITLLGGSGSAQITETDTITYIPIEKSTNVNIVFSYRKLNQIENEEGDLVDGYEVKLGNLIITVSDTSSTNNFPVANDFDYSKEFNQEVEAGEKVFIDVKNYIEDADTTDELQLVNVLSFNSDVAIVNPTDLVNPTDFTNTIFSFDSNQPGYHEVSYVISDHRGGYDIGTIQILVEPTFALIDDWKPLEVFDPVISDTLKFTPPLSGIGLLMFIMKAKFYYKELELELM